jgi:hypothetical protein
MAPRGRRAPKRAFETCPNCGESFPAGRLACPGCGSDAETGWRESEDIDYMSLDLPEDEPEPTRSQRRGRSFPLGRVILIVTLAAFAWWCLGRF